MASKIFLLLGLSLAIVLLIASEAAARDLAADASITSKDALDVAEGGNGLENDKHEKGGYYGGGKGGGGGYGKGGGGGYGKGGGGGYGKGGGGGYGKGGGGGYRKGGRHCHHYCHGRCCEATEVQPHN